MPLSNAPADHQLAVLRSIVQSTLSSRSTIYASDDLAEVNNNGGDRINKKIQQILGKLVSTYPGAENMVKEEVGKMGRGGERKAADEGSGSPTKSPKRTPSTGGAKKGRASRKGAEAEEEAEEEDLEDESS